MKRERAGNGAAGETFTGEPVRALSDNLVLARDARGWLVATRAGHVLSRGSTRWRAGAVRRSADQLPPEYRIKLHDRLAVTAFYCPASGALLAVDFHEKDSEPVEDTLLDLDALAGHEGIANAAE
jgi:N-methylhydantoinase B